MYIYIYPTLSLENSNTAVWSILLYDFLCLLCFSHITLLAVFQRQMLQADTTPGPLHQPGVEVSFPQTRVLCSLYVKLQPVPLSESQLSWAPLVLTLSTTIYDLLFMHCSVEKKLIHSRSKKEMENFTLANLKIITMETVFQKAS